MVEKLTIGSSGLMADGCIFHPSSGQSDPFGQKQVLATKLSFETLLFHCQVEMSVFQAVKGRIGDGSQGRSEGLLLCGAVG